MSFRVVYFGTPAFAVPALATLAGDARFDIRLVVTQPDRPAGRGRKIAASAVKTAAMELGIPVYQPDSLRTPYLRKPLVEADADLFIVAAYGMIFGPKTLALPRLGCVNLHASLLPAYRGASPITAALLQQDQQTGITMMLMDAGLDTGPIIAQRQIRIDPDDTTASLTGRLADLGSTMVRDNLLCFANGELMPVPQSGAASRTRPLVKADGWIDWTRPADELEAHVRAMWPWPRAYTTLAAPPGQSELTVMQVHSSRVELPTSASETPRLPGTVRATGSTVSVQTGEGSLILDTVQMPGRRPMPASALIAGRMIGEGTRLGEHGAPSRPSPLLESELEPQRRTA